MIGFGSCETNCNHVLTEADTYVLNKMNII